jgi:hypothetical protein
MGEAVGSASSRSVRCWPKAGIAIGPCPGHDVGRDEVARLMKGSPGQRASRQARTQTPDREVA